MGTSRKVNIALGITGGIAAYKSAELTRLLTAAGYGVHPVMTQWAAQFIGPLTMEALSGNQVQMETPGQADGIAHISVMRSADLLVIAPLTANTMAKMAQGLADNFLTAAYLAHRGPVLACPAMNTAMLEHPATQRNLDLLRKDGVHFCFGEAGDLACGEVGAGRMAEPTVIFETIEALVAPKPTALHGQKVLVSAGPTCEDLDPVRFLSNRSSGKMGLAIARAFQHAGAKVTLVHGPIHEKPSPDMACVPVRSAGDMAQAIRARAADMSVIVMAAAVADYRPPMKDQKLKKSNFDGQLSLERTEDILAGLGARKPPGQYLVGFAAESENLAANALDKLNRKNLDLICANCIAQPGTGFAGNQNRLILFEKDGDPLDLGHKDKRALGRDLVAFIAERLERLKAT